MVSFPTSLPTFPSAATLAGHNLSTDPHSTLHGNLGDELAAVAAKVGIDGSAVTTALDWLIKKNLALGWFIDSTAWTRVSNTQYTVARDTTVATGDGSIDVCTLLRWTESGTKKFAVVASVSYSAPNTTVNLISTTDYVMAASPDAANGTTQGHWYAPAGAPPHDFPEFFVYTPASITGWSTPTTSTEYRWQVKGRTLRVVPYQGTATTSNATTISISLPTNVTAASPTTTANFYGPLLGQTDATTPGTVPGRMRVTAGGTSIAADKDISGAGGWTASGTKRIIGFIDVQL